MATLKQSDRIREIVLESYVLPALRAGSKQFSIPARHVLKLAEASEDFPRGRTPTICAVLQSKKLLDESGLEIERVEGPPSRQSRKVVVHYRVRQERPEAKTTMLSPLAAQLAKEDSAAWAERVASKLNGLLRKEIEAFGGADALMQWIRSDEQENGAVA